MAQPIIDGVVIAFQSPRLEWVWFDAGRDRGLKPERLLWMHKPNDETFPWRGWLLKSEAIRVMSIGKPEWVDIHPYAHDTYINNWSIGNDDFISGLHTTIKPIPVIQDLVSRVGGIVYDPFLGSGTTIVACERLGRLGRGIEISPAYVAVSLQRLADMGLEPELVNT